MANDFLLSLRKHRPLAEKAYRILVSLRSQKSLRRKDIPLTNEEIYKPRFTRDFDSDLLKDDYEAFAKRSSKEQWLNFSKSGYIAHAQIITEIDYAQLPLDQKLRHNQKYYSRRPRSWWINQHRDIAINDDMYLKEVRSKKPDLALWTHYYRGVLLKNPEHAEHLKDLCLDRWIKYHDNFLYDDAAYDKEKKRQIEMKKYPRPPFYSAWMDYFRDIAISGEKLYETLQETRLSQAQEEEIYLDPEYLVLYDKLISDDIGNLPVLAMKEVDKYWTSFSKNLEDDYLLEQYDLHEKNDLLDWPGLWTEERTTEWKAELDSSYIRRAMNSMTDLSNRVPRPQH